MQALQNYYRYHANFLHELGIGIIEYQLVTTPETQLVILSTLAYTAVGVSVQTFSEPIR